MGDFPSAFSAKNMSDIYHDSSIVDKMVLFRNIINNACANGYYGATVESERYDADVVAWLRLRGYYVVYDNGGRGEPGFYTISWKKPKSKKP